MLFRVARNCLLSPPTEKSSYKIIGEICHIHSPKESGPRGRVGLTDEEYNAHDNLIVLCPNHHTRVDGQHEAYPAQTLKEWKETHEAKSSRVSPQDLDAPPEVFYHSYFPTALVDQTIDEEVNLLRKSRFYVEFDGIGCTLTLSKRLSEGNLYGGTATVKAWALAWCARVLAGRGELDKAEEYLEIAESLGPGTEIARAFICSKRGDRSTALKLLAGIIEPSSRSTSFIIVGNHDGPQKAVKWLKAASLNVTDLDPDGKLALLTYQLKLEQWEAARETAKALSESDLEEVPVLHHMMAMSYLIETVPPDYRNVVLRHVPFNAAACPLASHAAAIEARRTARINFVSAAEFAKKLNCPQAAAEPDGYALWLELRDPEYSESGRQRLERKLSDLKSALHLVSLGLQYGIPLDRAKIEQEIERQVALQGEITQDAAFARLALARMQKDPEGGANDIARHYDTLSPHLDTKVIRSIQVEMLSKAGQSEKARECLELLLKEGLTQVEESRLRMAIEEGEGKDTLEARKSLFKHTNSIIELEALVYELENRREWGALSEYGELLFGTTGSMQDAERLANALHFAGKSARVIDLLESNDDILSQSRNLQMCYCWALYHEGELLRAHCELAKLGEDWEDENYRTLQISMSIALGDWDSLSVYVAKEHQAKEERSARDLIRAAQLALSVDSPYAKQLARAAAARDSSDAGVLASVYFVASKAGWEREPQFVQCLHKAVELSGDDGPFMKFTLQDVLDKKSDGGRQESSAREVLSRGQGPMVFAGPFLNKSLTNFILFPALANSTERDLRRKVGIPAFSGQRQPTPLVTSATVGLDYTTLLTLDFLDLLDKVFDAFDTVYVPHSALAWLFEERQNASFHQPSRIKDARQVLHLLATYSLERLSPSTIADRELSDYVGDDLATFIAEAENARHGDTQRLVVRPSPVYEAASLGEKKADLTSHSSVLVSCQAVVEKLSHMAEITDSVEKNALAYLQLQEKPWPHQPEVADKAILYLDDLAVYYFLHTGILETLCKPEFKLFVSSGLVSELNALIAFEHISGKVIDAIENMRSAVRQGIECGTVKVGKWRKIGNGDEQYLNYHQIAGLFALAEDCDAIIADDRFFNKDKYIDHNDVQTPLFATLDVLDALVSAGHISADDRLECRTKLRRAGYFFVPVTEDELTCHLNAAEVKNGMVIERAHLKAIRESILHARMNDWLQLPIEALWLDSVFEVFANVLRSLWTESADLPSAKACSNWILDQVDVRGWAHCLSPENREEIIKSGRVRFIFMLLTPLDADVPLIIREAHREWVEVRVLAPVKEQCPDLYALIVNLKQRQISELVNRGLTEEGQNDE